MSTPRIWLKVRHDTAYDYDAPVELAHHMAHLGPRETPNQIVRGWRLIVDPAPDEWLQGRPTDDSGVPQGQHSVDSWGNVRVAFSHARVHERLQVQSSFEAGLLPQPEPDPDNSPPWEEAAQALRYHAGAVRSEAVEFSLPTIYAPRDPALAALGHEAFTPGASVVSGALTLMQLIHERFTYEPHATSVHTRAPESLAELRGVCQDYAHVMIGACRSLGLAARYVSGYLLTQPPPGQPRLVGADASHAWVHVWCPTQGWIALDPTNAVPAGTDHVTLAWGRDYADVAPLRGVIRGGGRALPKVGVTVEPVG
jgi:transglutaminase-like putative cysteine protease